MFTATYAENLPALEGKQHWDIVDPGFKLCAPIQHRAPGRPRKQRIRISTEGKGLGPRKHKCKRCGRCGQKAKDCKQSIDPAFGEYEHCEADNAYDHPTTNERAEAEIQEEEEEGETVVDVLHQEMPPPKEPSHGASIGGSCVVSPRKNYKRAAESGASLRCKQNTVVEPTNFAQLKAV
ncbi:hypothetical protein D1007_41408 [Hordeum vulgare]|nr:hypothetical protein D1007_41408 [Hordeum vulgare]